MTKISKILTGAAVAAMVTVGAAAPANAQYYRHYDRDDGIDLGDVITGVAVVGGIAAVAGALSNATRGAYNQGYYGNYGNYGYGHPGYGYGYNNYRYGYGEQAAVQACSYQAQRYGQGRVSITDIDRRNRRSFRVRGVIDAGYNGGYYNRYDRYDRYGSRIAFECDARDNGRVTDFDIDRYRY